VPTVSTSPRSSGSSPRGGRIASAPRSASSGTSRRTSSTPRGLDLTRASVAQAAQFNAAARRDTPDEGPGPAFTPIRVLLDATSAPAYTLGNLLAGRPKDAAKNLVSAGQWGRKTYVSDALRERGALPKNWIGTALGLGIDIATDPTTYVTFGAGGAAKAAGKAGASHLVSEAAKAAAKGKRIPLGEVAKASAIREAALAGVERKLSVGFRVPFTRGKVIPIVESGKAARAGQRVSHAIGSTRTGENLREVFLPAGSGSKVAHRVGSDVRRYGETEKRVISQQATKYQRDVAKAAKAAGLSEADAHKALTRNLDNPLKYPVPAPLAGLRDDAARQLDALRKLEDTSGIQRGVVPDYVPHLPANAAARREVERMFPMPPDSPFFFQKPRELPNLDAWEALGLKPEYNLARLLEVRGHASVDARVMKAFDNVAKDLPGVNGAQILHVKELMRPSITSHYAIRDSQHFINSVGSSWKALALTSPGYHMRNMQSDLLSAYWAGARNPLSFIQAAKALRGGKATVKIRGQVYTYDELVNLAESAGAIRLGQAGKEIRGELAEAGGAALRKSGLRPSRPGFGKVARASQAVGNAREDMVRLGTFIERMKAGDDVMSAAKVTRDFLYDYGDVGRFVKAARRFWLPFITFPSKAIPMVGRVALQRPGTLANLNKAINASNQLAGNPDLSLLSAGQRSSFGVPAPSWLRTAIGAPEGQPLLFNPESVTAYGALNNADPTNPIRGLAGLLNPVPKGIIEGKTGYSFYFNGPGGTTTRSPAIINLLAKHGIPIAGMGEKTNRYSGQTSQVYSRKLDLILRLFPQYGQSASLIPGGGSDTTRLPYLKYFGGLSISPYDRARDAFYAEKNRDRQ